MTLQTAKPPRRRQGFTLVELLTVVAIISLLISILLPSLSRARDQARRARVRAMLHGIDTALEMFYSDFNRYPNSNEGEDPITDFGGGSNTLSGAHWLARALVGHDYEGVDTEGRMMRPGGSITLTELEGATRTGVYMEGPMFARDDDESKFFYGGDADDYVPTGRPVVYDELFGSPVLYYRANARARLPFADSSGFCPVNSGSPGIYSQRDNRRITGGGSMVGWDFAGAGQHPLAAVNGPHPLGAFSGSGYNPADIDSMCGDQNGVPGSFADFLHSETAQYTAGRARPVNAERFVLISAGRDGVFGTSDDITNFEQGR
jgi:prepilin-type N-terminal cleavage/methylation domain-containing protein